MARSHDIRITVAGSELDFWLDYQIELDLLRPSDAFSFSTPIPDPRTEADTYEALRVGREVTISIDGAPVITGYLTRVDCGDDRLRVSGVDKVWRLVRESAPLRRFGRVTLTNFAEEIAGGVFGRVALSNARNRDLYASKGNRRQGAEPPVFDRPDDPRKIPVGATRWTALSEVLRRAELLAWSSGDGAELVLGRPKFGQEPSFRFVRALDEEVSTCESISWSRSIEERYSEVVVLAAVRKPRESRSGETVAGQSERRTARGTVIRSGSSSSLVRRAVVFSDPSGDFTFPLRLRVVEDARSIEEAERLAQAALDEGDASAFTVAVEAWQHGQDGRLYAPDTVAEVEDQRAGLRSRFYITRVAYQGSRFQEGASLTMVPLGTRLVTQ